MSEGECTMTLQDIVVLPELPFDGDAVTNLINMN
ncbi:uncharacterized protein J3R85_001646 [Psidium guajava]|nr:uncharacterized protein J3R85_001646 [Psidium guajava]